MHVQGNLFVPASWTRTCYFEFMNFDATAESMDRLKIHSVFLLRFQISATRRSTRAYVPPLTTPTAPTTTPPWPPAATTWALRPAASSSAGQPHFGMKRNITFCKRLTLFPAVRRDPPAAARRPRRTLAATTASTPTRRCPTSSRRPWPATSHSSPRAPPAAGTRAAAHCITASTARAWGGGRRQTLPAITATRQV